MAVEVDQAGDVRRIILSGRLDADGVKEVETEFNEAATAEPNIIVDLSAVPFLASLGIRMLVAASQEQQKMGGKVVLVSPDEMTMRILKTTGIHQLIPVTESIDEAVAKF